MDVQSALDYLLGNNEYVGLIFATNELKFYN
jgi:hypothetical protein